MNPLWLTWSKRLQAIAQDGLTYSDNPYDQERYNSIRNIAAEVASAGSGMPFEGVKAVFDREVGPATPKVDVRAVIILKGAILLVRECDDGCWSLPGGWAEVHESPGEAIVREVQEESGYQVKPTKLLALYDITRHEHTPCLYSVYKLVFHCEPTGASPGLHSCTDDVQFFGQHELPPLSLARVTPAQIARFFEFERHPEWQTDFD